MGREQLPGWFDYADIYDQAIRDAPNFATFVEIGVAFGKSISYLAEQAMALQKRLRIFGVDPWIDDWDSDAPTWGAEHAPAGRALGGPFNAVTYLMHTECPRALEYVRLVRAPSVMAARMFDDGSVFFVFVDGSHHYEDVAADLAAWEPKMVNGGIIAGHDYHDAFPGVVKAVHERWGPLERVGEQKVCFRRVVEPRKPRVPPDPTPIVGG